MLSFKIVKKFCDSDRKEYKPGDSIELDEIKNRIKIDRMIYYGIIGNKPIGKKKQKRKPIVERAAIL